MRKVTKLAAVACVALHLNCNLAVAISPPSPPPGPPVTHESLDGEWIGPSQDGGYFSLRLGSNGRGLFVVQEGRQAEVSIFRVVATEIHDVHCAFTLKPVDDANPSRVLFGECKPPKLELTTTTSEGKQGKSTKLTLQSADVLLSRIRAVRGASTIFRVTH